MARAAALLLILSLAFTGQQADSPSQTVPLIRVHGAQFVDDSGRAYIPRWVSGLTLLSRPLQQQTDFLDWAVKTGFNGVRVFAGALTWAEQTPESARRELPGLLERAAARGLVVEVTALTDTGSGYDARAHLQETAAILAGRRGVVLELANEVGNSSQSADLTPDRLRQWGQEIVTPRGLVWAVGAANTDQPVKGKYPTHGGAYITVHLDRGGDMWPQIARIRMLANIAALHQVPVIDNEPMGADEQPGRQTGRQRWNDPAGFFAMGALDRAFNLGGVHHSQAGLMGELPGPVQQQCAEAYVAGHRAIESVLGAERGVFVEAGRGNAPVQAITGIPPRQVLTFVAAGKAVVVLIGAAKDASIQWRSGWRKVVIVKSMTGLDGRRVDVIHATSR